MKVAWNTCDKERGGEIKSAEEKLPQKFTWKLPKVTPLLRNLCKIFREKQWTDIYYSYVT